MARQRSPEYPNFSLRRALQRTDKIFAADRRNPIDRNVMVVHMGYGGQSGAADKALATLQHYGLVERTGKGELRVSQLAVEILHPNSPEERKRALATAAFSPQLFKALRMRFPEGVSPEALKSYLVRENFLDRAIAPITAAYTDTCSFLKQESAYESGGTDESDVEGSASLEESEPMDATTESVPRAQVLSRTPGVGPISKAELVNLPPAGWTQAVFPLAEGAVFLNFPEHLTADGYAELKEYLDIFLRRAERAQRQREGSDDQGTRPG